MSVAGFIVEPKAFLQLSPERAVTLFRQLLWAESDRVGVGRHLINVPNCINVGDGGVDAYINDVHPSHDEVIPEGSSVYQIKSTDIGPTACKRELHTARDLSKSLKDELDVRLRSGAAYVLVLFADITDAKIRQRRKAIEKELAKFGYANTEVRVFTANHLAGFTNRHPSLVSSLRPELSICSPYDIWGSSYDIRRPAAFVMDSARREMVKQITETVRTRTTCLVIRVTGLPGVGKTRSVYEALRHYDLRNQVLYVQRAADLVGSSLLQTLANDPGTSAILVVDECNIDNHRLLTNSLAGWGPRLALITMSYEVGRVPMPTVHLNTEPLQQETVESILQQEYPGMPNLAVRRLAEFADGYPRIADLLAGQAIGDPNAAEYITVSDDQLMNRLIGGSASADSHQFMTTKAVLMGISLFQRIGVSGLGEAEGRWIAGQVGVSWREFQRIVAREKERGTVQGEYYVFVTPFMLRIHLQEEWWKAHGFSDEHGFDRFVNGMPKSERPDLLRRFLEHFRYIAADPRGAKFVRMMLAESGIASNYELLDSELGGRLFLALAEADPETALQTAQRMIGSKTPDELLEFREGRRAMVDALAYIAVWKELFQPAARLLLALAEAENESWANNASGMFADLFSLGYGEAASTEAPPADRFLILREALSSDSRERRKLALQACKTALSTGPFRKVGGVEYRGVRRDPDLWDPKTYGVLFDAFRTVWKLTRESVRYLTDQDKALAVHVLMSSARGLTRLGPLVDMIVETIRDLASEPNIDRREIVSNVVQILHYDGSRMDAEIRSKWQRLLRDLSGTDFGSRIERYVAFALPEDQFDEKAMHSEKAKPHFEELASQSAKAPELLLEEMHWLVTKHARSGGQFGLELGKRDTEMKFLPHILKSQANAGDDVDLSFLGCYLGALFDRNSNEWEELLDGFARDPVQMAWVVGLTWRSGTVTGRASRRIIDLMRAGESGPEELSIFRYSAAIKSLKRKDFSKWVDLLLDIDDYEAVTTALDLLVMYGGYNKFKEPALRIVCHPIWFRRSEERHFMSYWWADVAKVLCTHHKEVVLEIAELMLNHAGESGTIVALLDQEPAGVLDVALRQNPWEIWKMATSLLGPPIDGRAFVIGHWLRGSEMFDKGGSHILEEVPPHLIWEWAEECPKFRPIILAEFVPRVFRGDKDGSCLARELLLQYGHDPEVRNALRGNFSTEGWGGPESEHLGGKISWLRDLRAQETNPNVLKWIDEYVAQLDQRAEYARQREEREGW